MAIKSQVGMGAPAESCADRLERVCGLPVSRVRLVKSDPLARSVSLFFWIKSFDGALRRYGKAGSNRLKLCRKRGGLTLD